MNQLFMQFINGILGVCKQTSNGGCRIIIMFMIFLMLISSGTENFFSVKTVAAIENLNVKVDGINRLLALNEQENSRQNDEINKNKTHLEKIEKRIEVIDEQEQRLRDHERRLRELEVKQKS